MSLVNNRAAELAEDDVGLASSPDASHVRASLAVANEDWKVSKEKINNMSELELQAFVDNLEGIPLNKSGYIRLRLTPREYAALRLKMKESKTGITETVIDGLT